MALFLIRELHRHWGGSGGELALPGRVSGSLQTKTPTEEPEEALREDGGCEQRRESQCPREGRGPPRAPAL